MDEITISVIVPVYNLEREISRCLDSILAQTHRALQIIVVNDGSTDNSAEIINTYAARDSRVEAVHRENGGVVAARECGISRARGEYVGFVDGDDEIEHDMYARLLSNAVKYDADISHCGYQMIFPDGRVSRFHATGELAVQARITALKELLSGERIEPGLCNKLFRKSLLHSLFHNSCAEDAVPHDIRINEDLLMNYRLFSAAERSVFEDVCLYHYIVRASSASRSGISDNKIYDPIRVKDIIRREADAELREAAQRAYIGTCLSVYNSTVTAPREYRTDKIKLRELLRDEKSDFYLLGTKRAFVARFAITLPLVYSVVYRIYSACFQKNPYV